MKLFFILVLEVFIYSSFTYSQLPDSLRDKFEIPKYSTNDVLIMHKGFSLVYNEKHEQASWVAYELTAEETVKSFERSNKFLEDPLVSSGTATDEDYSSSGYDRGHLAPAADMSWSEQTMRESFFYSNMSPQTPSFNRGIWKKLEEKVRDWATEYKQLFVVTGPILSDTLSLSIGINKVTVPRYYYKVLCDTLNKKGIGFVLPNSASSLPLNSFAISIDSVEVLTGINFFPTLSKKDEVIYEKQVCIECWNWGNTLKVTEQIAPSKVDTTKLETSVRCIATPKAGKRCKSKTLSPNSKCSKHGGN